MRPVWTLLDPRMTFDALGLIPDFLDDEDPRSAREQINEKYISGWQPFVGHELDRKTGALKYPGDPAMKPLAQVRLRDERLTFYDCAWLCIMQPDGSYEIA